MDLTTQYLGLELPHPFMVGASPMVDDLDTVRRLEDAGTAAIVMHSLFEEQLGVEQMAVASFLDDPAGSFAEATSYLPEPEDFALGPEEYLEQMLRVKEAVAVPVIASLNGTREGRWLDYANQIEAAGADALELNVYRVASDPREDAVALEEQVVAMVQQLKETVTLPVAVKLSPFYTAMANFAVALEQAGADGLVLFNRFYQADIDVDELRVDRTLHLSDSSELLLRLRWLAILSGHLRTSLAVSGGVHDPIDAVKAVMTGADVVQLVSVLLKRGPEYLGVLRHAFESWLVDYDYDSLDQLRGSMSLARCPDPSAYERANYMRVLQSVRVGKW